MRRYSPAGYVAVGLALLSVACPDGREPTPLAMHRIQLAQDLDGNLDCVAPEELTCADLPYDGDCLVIELEIDPTSARACQTCRLADGSTLEQGCDQSVVSCVLVTLPEPDCVVCAYQDGAVIFSTCVASRGSQCASYATAGGRDCERCFDPLGRIVYDSCLPDCGTVICPPLACPPGLAPVRRPNECCARCEAAVDCSGVVCAQDFAVPACPPGTILSRDPGDCCGYLCQPSECTPFAGAEMQDPLPASCATHLDCPEGALCTDGVCGAGDSSLCPAGYVWRDDFPYCGQCVAGAGGSSCLSDFDCAYGQYCAYDAATCGAVPEPGSNGAPLACTGTCRPLDPSCATASGAGAPIVPCEGEWLVGYDAAGCPYPICVCPDGSQSLDGVCRDLCANVDCLIAPAIACELGMHVEYRYPYCCGVCVPDDVCAYVASGATPTGDAPVLVCPEIGCAFGFHPEIDPATCCPTCVPDVANGCLSSNECALGFYCSTEDGVCAPPPGCDPIDNACAGICYGECLPIDDLERPDCVDSDGGLEPYLPGEVLASSGGLTEIVADVCTPDGRAVIEQYCYTRSDGRYRQAVTVQCTGDAAGDASCVDGACR